MRQKHGAVQVRANPLDVRQHYEMQLRGLQEAYGEAMLELCAQKSIKPCFGRRTRSDPVSPTGLA